MTGLGHSVGWGDIDNDGWLDSFTSWHLEPNQLYRNNGDNTFTDVASDLGLTGGGYLDFFGAGWADYTTMELSIFLPPDILPHMFCLKTKTALGMRFSSAWKGLFQTSTV